MKLWNRKPRWLKKTRQMNHQEWISDLSEQQMTRENMFIQDKETCTNHSWLLSIIRKKLTLFLSGIFMEIHIMCNLKTLYTLSTSFHMLVLLLSELVKSKRGLKLNQNCPGATYSFSCIQNWYSKRTPSTPQMLARTVTIQMVIFVLQGQ